MGNANSSQTRRRRRSGNGAEMFAGFQPGTQVGLGVGRPGARVGAGRPGARRWIMPPTVDRNHLDTMDPATYALVRDMLTRQYLAAHGPALMAPALSPVVAPRGRAHAPAPRGPVVPRFVLLVPNGPALVAVRIGKVHDGVGCVERPEQVLDEK